MDEYGIWSIMETTHDGGQGQAGIQVIHQPEEMIARARSIWPDCRYLEHATIGAGLAWDAQQQRGVERAGMVVVEVKGER